MEIKLFKTKKNFKKKSTEPDPGFYWKLIISLVFVLIVASFVFGYYMFIQVKEDLSALPENFGKKQLIDKKRIDKVFEYFSLREKKSTEIINSFPPTVDPSI